MGRFSFARSHRDRRVDPDSIQRVCDGVARPGDERESRLSRLRVGVKHRTLPIEGVERLCERPRVRRDRVRFEIVGGRLDDGREPREHSQEVPFFGLAQSGDVGFVGYLTRIFRDATATRVDVLNVGRRLGLEVKRSVPFEGDAFRRLFRNDVLPDRADTDLMGDALDVVVV